jgi:hypothetical protein
MFSENIIYAEEKKKNCPLGDLNQQPLAHEAGALTTRLAILLTIDLLKW